MPALIPQQGPESEVPGFKSPEAFSVPKSTELPQETREARVERAGQDENAKPEELDVAAVKDRVFQQAEKSKATGEVSPGEVDADTKAMLEGLMTGKIGLDEVDEFDPDAVTRGLMN